MGSIIQSISSNAGPKLASCRRRPLYRHRYWERCQSFCLGQPRSKLNLHIGGNGTREIQHHARNVTRHAKSSARILSLEVFFAPENFDQTVRELRREETWSDCIGGDISGAELDRKVPRQVMCSRFRRRVHYGSMFANVRDVYACC